MRGITIGGLAAVVLVSACRFSDDRRVEYVIEHPIQDENGQAWDNAARDLRPLGERALPLLAAYLQDPHHSYIAIRTMISIDQKRATLLIMPVLARIDTAARDFAFQYYAVDRPDHGAPGHSRELHEAAELCLKDKISCEKRSALDVLGRTGSPSDYPLLESCIAIERLKDNAIEALLKLGNEKYLKMVENTLSAPVPRHLSQKQDFDIQRAVFFAELSGNSRFIRPLCRHLNDQRPKWYGGGCANGDLGTSPSDEVCSALSRIVTKRKTITREAHQRWNDWCLKKGYPVR